MSPFGHLVITRPLAKPGHLDLVQPQHQLLKVVFGIGAHLQHPDLSIMAH